MAQKILNTNNTPRTHTVEFIGKKPEGNLLFIQVFAEKRNLLFGRTVIGMGATRNCRLVTFGVEGSCSVVSVLLGIVLVSEVGNVVRRTAFHYGTEGQDRNR